MRPSIRSLDSSLIKRLPANGIARPLTISQSLDLRLMRSIILRNQNHRRLRSDKPRTPVREKIFSHTGAGSDVIGLGRV